MTAICNCSALLVSDYIWDSSRFNSGIRPCKHPVLHLGYFWLCFWFSTCRHLIDCPAPRLSCPISSHHDLCPRDPCSHDLSGTCCLLCCHGFLCHLSWNSEETNISIWISHSIVFVVFDFKITIPETKKLNYLVLSPILLKIDEGGFLWGEGSISHKKKNPDKVIFYKVQNSQLWNSNHWKNTHIVSRQDNHCSFSYQRYQWI